MAAQPPIVQQPTNTPETAPPLIVQQPHNYTPNQYQQPGYYGQQPPNMSMAPPTMLPPPEPVPGVPIGLEPLIPLGHLFVKQQVEILEMTMGIETPNRYDVLTGNGERVYLAAETTPAGIVAGGLYNRAFTIDIVDSFGRRVMILNRVDSGCCTGGEMFVTLGDGSKLGTVKQLGCNGSQFHITDETDVVVMVIKEVSGSSCCCVIATDYPITTKKDGSSLGIIRKTFAGFVQEYYTDADNFGVEFLPDLNVRWKSLMFAAVFLIDFLYFESSPHHHRHRRHSSSSKL